MSACLNEGYLLRAPQLPPHVVNGTLSDPLVGDRFVLSLRFTAVGLILKSRVQTALYFLPIPWRRSLLFLFVRIHNFLRAIPEWLELPIKLPTTMMIIFVTP